MTQRLEYFSLRLLCDLCVCGGESPIHTINCQLHNSLLLTSNFDSLSILRVYA